MKNINIKICVILLIVMLSAVNTQSWGPITHYSLGRDLGFGEKSGNINLPDAWPADSKILWLIPYAIDDWFTWTHAVQRTGRTRGVVPKVPRYVDDGREPGRIMHIIAKDKIKWDKDNEKQLALDTARGFTGHNGMDREVHWDYFLGATGNEKDIWEATNKWSIHHGRKEKWADYVVARWKGDLSFDETTGKINTLFGVDVRKNSLMKISGCPKVIQIAQKVARKNRRRMDFENDEEKNIWTKFDRKKTIENNRIKWLQKEIDGGIKEMNIETYDSLLESAIQHNWVKRSGDEIIYDEVQMFYNKSRKTAQEWLNELR